MGIWDIMGSAAGQWPLAQSLVDLGFENAGAIQEVSGAGVHSVTLYAHYSDKGSQAVKVASPYSSDEYFVFEYRQKDANALAPDHLVPSSGLVVYRVNDAVDKDVNGHHTNRINENGYYEDSIYVFRPGETGIHDSAGTLMNAALSTSAYAYLGNAANTRTTFGSSDMSKTIADGAIVDSSDRNSGLSVNITAQNDGSISFDLSIPDYSSLSLWDAVGSDASASQADCISSATSSDGAIYQAYLDTDGNTNTQSIHVRSWNGTEWTALGTVASGALGRPQLECVGTALYCSYSDFGSSSAYRIAKWVSGTTWSQMASVSTGSSYANAPTAAVIDGSLYALVDNDNKNVQMYKLNGFTLAAIGAPLGIGYVTEAKIGSANGNLIVACGDVGSQFSEKTGQNIYVLDGSTWAKAYSETSNIARNIASASLGDSLLTLTAYDSGVMPKIRIVSAAGTVSATYDFTSAGSNLQDVALSVSGDNAYITVIDGEGLTTTWYAPTSSLGEWTQLGEACYSGASTGSGSLSSLISSGKMYVSVMSGSSTAVTMRSHNLASSPAPVTYTVTASAERAAPSALMARRRWCRELRRPIRSRPHPAMRLRM